MKAILIEKHGGPEVLQYTDVPDPELGPNDVLIDVKASGVNPNEYWAREGKVRKFELPLIVGSDAAGVIKEVGDHVEDVKVGDEVVAYCGVGCRHCYRCVNGEEHICEKGFRIWGFDAGPMWGAHADLVRLPAHNVVAKPKNLDWVQAASLQLTLVTAWHMLVSNARIQPNETVLIRGASGGVGFFATQIAKMRGAKVIAVGSSEEKAAIAQEYGADHTIVRPRDTEETFPKVSKAFRSQVRELAPLGVDCVFDSVGGRTLMESIKMMRHGGRLVTCGATTGYATQIELAYMFIQNKTIMGSTLGTKAELMQALRAVEAGHIKPYVSETFHLAKAAEAETLLQSGKATGKVVLTR
jgi:alcohol dehydrogenase